MGELNITNVCHHITMRHAHIEAPANSILHSQTSLSTGFTETQVTCLHAWHIGFLVGQIHPVASPSALV